jgi:class 3 adenylate cyclase
MKCSKCHSENRDGVRFCEECGAGFGLQCPNCSALLPESPKFCGECGEELSAARERSGGIASSPGQRKLVSILFSDLAGYTSMTERLDPEEVKEVMDSIFGKTAQVITKYEGFIEKFAGDAVMAIFGAPKVHEDDAIRAIRAAMEIHDVVSAVGSKVEDRIGQSLMMHSGIDSGVVVASEMDSRSGTHRFTGDAINRASRLCGLASSGEILVGAGTYREAEGHFEFEACDPVSVKGKSRPIKFYRIKSPRVWPAKPQRMHGMRADLIGRTVELAQLKEARDGPLAGDSCLCLHAEHSLLAVD